MPRFQRSPPRTERAPGRRGGADPYPALAAGSTLRLAFVGQATFFAACALVESSRRISTAYLDFRAGADAEAMLARLRRFSPHVVVVFRPEVLPPGIFAELRAPVVGVLTEPVPRRPGRRAHPDLLRRRGDLAALDPGNVDRLVAFDPHIVPTVDPIMPVWRAFPLPVADQLFTPPGRAPAGRGILFVGRSTAHREAFLARPKVELDVTHAAFGIGTDELAGLMASHPIAVNLHNEPYPSFENRVCLHLAAGQLLVSETLDPTHGLEPDIDYLEIAEADQFLAVLRTAVRFPQAYERVRARGRRKAETFRASRVYPRLVEDLMLDLRAFGTHRAA